MMKNGSFSTCSRVKADRYYRGLTLSLDQERHDMETPLLVRQVRAEYKKIMTAKGRLVTADIRALAIRMFGDVKHLPQHKMFRACEQLLDAGYTAIPFQWTGRVINQLAPTDFRRLDLWLKTYVTDWGSCDDFCVRVMGPFLYRFPALIPRTEKWAVSSNCWLRRASAVALIYSARRGDALPDIFQRADLLLVDGDDMVRKGYGWMLKEAANRFPREVFDYVMAHKRDMPRTALRYAIEKMPPEWKTEAMKKDW